MAQEIGEARETWGRAVWQQAEDFANNMKSEQRPFYIVYAAKPDRHTLGVFRTAMKAYYNRPAPMLGLLVWFVDNANGIFQFMPELSAPPDMPIDPSLMSTASADALPSVMSQGKKLNALVS